MRNPLPLQSGDVAWLKTGASIRVVRVVGVTHHDFGDGHPFSIVTVPSYIGLSTDKVHHRRLFKLPEEREALIEDIESDISGLQNHLDEALEGDGDEEHLAQLRRYYGVDR